jgi:glycosyltransferase involved in cell wall biosynthesis
LSLKKQRFKIAWFLSGLEECEDGYTSNLASTRLRGLEIAKSLNGRPDVAVTVIPLQKRMVIDPHDMATFDVAVIGKIFRTYTPLFELLKSLGVPMVFDMCDDIYEQGRDCYDGVFDFGEGIVASTPLLGKIIEGNIGRRCAVIPDLQDGFEVAPQAINISKSSLKLLWYGLAVNLAGLLEALPRLKMDFPNRLSIDVVTNLNDQTKPYLADIQKDYEGTVKLRPIQWSLVEMVYRFAICDAVIIPSVDDRKRRVKTANRLMNALWAGKPCIAYPVPSYTEFEEFVVLEQETSVGVQHLLDHDPKSLRDKLKRGQDYIREHYSPEAISDRWLAELTSTILPRRDR